MSPAPLVHLAYPWRGASERLIRIGDGGPAILFIAPLFEEANRIRHFMIEAMRGVAAKGYACFLPDLPGTLESATPLETLDWDNWTGAIGAVVAAIGKPRLTASFRTGCLLDGWAQSDARWRLAPQDGASVMRELIRIRMAANRENSIVTTMAEIDAEAMDGVFEVAGYRLSPKLTRGLKAAQVEPSGTVRLVRLESDIQPADLTITAQPLWRRSEPDHDPVFCQSVIDDISYWASLCAAG
ncbi:hypothetical protein [Sphingobium boeckii]|uniref:Uncharacterized protein n=1 Tax=Sphingobium boeckii TaxID=1082345 RepID=A0A7W9AKW4_9SPHN|nr:hypothetical protein [Sphingobium boeckii]MBB5687403.1 hypothetical protein [Sphingobium boeckii]